MSKAPKPPKSKFDFFKSADFGRIKKHVLQKICIHIKLPPIQWLKVPVGLIVNKPVLCPYPLIKQGQRQDFVCTKP